MNLKRPLAMLLSLSVFASALPSINAFAADAGSGRTPFTDWHEITTEPWDGVTYDTSWYEDESGNKTHTGTADDPFIISNTNEYAGFTQLANADTFALGSHDGCAPEPHCSIVTSTNDSLVDIDSIVFTPKYGDRLNAHNVYKADDEQPFNASSLRIEKGEVNEHGFYPNLRAYLTFGEKTIRVNEIEDFLRKASYDGSRLNYKVSYKLGDSSIKITYEYHGLNAVYLEPSVLGVTVPDTVLARNYYGDEKYIYSEDWENYDVYVNASYKVYDTHVVNNELGTVEIPDVNIPNANMSVGRYSGTITTANIKCYSGDVDYAVITDKGYSHCDSPKHTYIAALNKTLVAKYESVTNPEDSAWQDFEITIEDPFTGEVFATRKLEYAISNSWYSVVSLGGSSFELTYDESTNKLNFLLYLGFVRYKTSRTGYTYERMLGCNVEGSWENFYAPFEELDFINVDDETKVVKYDSSLHDIAGTHIVSASPVNPLKQLKDDMYSNAGAVFVPEGGDKTHIKVISDINFSGVKPDSPQLNNVDLDFTDHFINWTVAANMSSTAVLHNVGICDTATGVASCNGVIKDAVYQNRSSGGNFIGSLSRGTINNVRIISNQYFSSFCGYSYDGTIENISILLTKAKDISEIIYRTIIFSSLESCSISNVTIDADSDRLLPSWYFAAVCSARSTSITGLEIKDFDMPCYKTAIMDSFVENTTVRYLTAKFKNTLTLKERCDLPYMRFAPSYAVDYDDTVQSGRYTIEPNGLLLSEYSDSVNFSDIDIDCIFSQVSGVFPTHSCSDYGMVANSKVKITYVESELPSPDFELLASVPYCNGLLSLGSYKTNWEITGDVLLAFRGLFNTSTSGYSKVSEYIDSNFSIDIVRLKFAGDFYPSYFNNCNVQINNVIAEEAVLRLRAYNSAFNIAKVERIVAGYGASYAFFQENSVLDSCTLDILECSGMSTSFTPPIMKDSSIHVTLDGELKYTQEYIYAMSNNDNRVDNSLIVVDAKDGAHGTIASPIRTTSNINNSFILLDLNKDVVLLATGDRGVSQAQNSITRLEHSTYIIKDAGLSAGTRSSVSLLRGQLSWDNFGYYADSYIDFSFYVKDSPNLVAITGAAADDFTYNSTFKFKFFDENGNPLKDKSFIGIHINKGAPLYGVHVESNIETAQAVFCNIDAMNGRLGAIKNCYFALPNQKAVPSGADLEHYVGFVPGFVGGFPYFGSPANWSYVVMPGAVAMGTNTVGIANSYVLTGQSKIPGNYTDNDSGTWMSSVNKNAPWGYPTDWVAGNPGDYSVYNGEGLKEIDQSAETTGELAYLLDGGSNKQHRTYAWTVTDETVIVNPFTGKEVMTLPKRLDHTTTYYDPRCVKSVASPSGELEQDPVYKYTITDVPDGDVTLSGIAGDKIDGDVYAKSGRPLVTDVEVTNPETILVYATQKLLDTMPSRIPSQSESEIQTFAETDAPAYNYNLVGYKGIATDTVITPVFKTARYITVDVTGSENGTIVPDTYVSAEGEQVKIKMDTKPGYTITNIAINGVPLNKSKFIMPDENVTITGDCIPFDGGILSFRLFGVDGVIDQIEHTIEVRVPKTGNIANGRAYIEYVGNYITPNEAARVDFTNPVTYTVGYGEDNQEVQYEVTVIQSEYTMRIHDFVMNGVHGEINQALKTIDVYLPSGTDLSDLTPEDIVYSSENITPAIDSAHDFRNGVVYTLSTAGMESVSYIVTAHAVDPDAAQLTSFKVSGYEGIIDEDEKEVTLNVPKGIDFSSIQPDLITYRGKAISPSKALAVDLSDVATYSVTNQRDEVTEYTIRTNYISDSTARIDRFALAGSEGIIDEENKIITVPLPQDTDVTGIVPDILLYAGKSIYPVVTAPQDFAGDDIVYTVVAKDNTEVPYTVKIVNSDARITKFVLEGIHGDIDQTNLTITLDIPYDFDVTDTFPNEIVYSDNAVLEPSETTKRDFTQPQKYTVTSEDGETSREYTVICNLADDYDNKILEYQLDGVKGTITDIGEDLGVIDITIKEHTPFPDYNDIAPDIIKISEKATITPSETEKQDFVDNKPTYTVTGRNNGERVYTVNLTVIPLDKTAEITKYSIDGYDGVIDQDTGTITVTVPADADIDKTKVDPDVVYKGTLDPTPDTVVDLTDPVKYTVTAEDPRVTKEYTVTLIESEDLSEDCIITEYVVNGTPGDIDQITGEITITIPEEKKPEYEGAVTPDRIVWKGESITPDEHTPINLFDEPEYKVKSESGVIKTYTIIMNIIPTPADDTCIITEYSANGIAGRVDQPTGTITIPVTYPYGTQPDKTPWINVVPDYIRWQGKTLTPDVGDAVNLVDGTIYRVVSEDAAIYKDYTVKVDFIEGDKPTPPTPPRPVRDDCDITEYTVLGQKADIDQTKLTITLPVKLSDADKIANIVPDSIIWSGSKLTPDEDDAVKIADGLEYTVTSKRGTTKKTYTLKIDWIDDRSKDCAILEYSVGGYVGDIDQAKGIITVTVPASENDTTVNTTEIPGAGGSKWQHIKPDYIKWTGEKLAPTETDYVDLLAGTTYRVTAENPAVYKDYFVKIEFEEPEETEEPTEETNEPTEETEEPTEEPTEETEEPTEETDEPTEETDESTEETDEPTEETDESTEETDEPTEETDEPTEEVPDKPKDPTDNPDTGSDEDIIWHSVMLALMAAGFVLATRKRKKD